MLVLKVYGKDLLRKDAEVFWESNGFLANYPIELKPDWPKRNCDCLTWLRGNLEVATLKPILWFWNVAGDWLGKEFSDDWLCWVGNTVQHSGQHWWATLCWAEHCAWWLARKVSEQWAASSLEWVGGSGTVSSIVINIISIMKTDVVQVPGFKPKVAQNICTTAHFPHGSKSKWRQIFGTQRKCRSPLQ